MGEVGWWGQVGSQRQVGSWRQVIPFNHRKNSIYISMQTGSHILTVRGKLTCMNGLLLSHECHGYSRSYVNIPLVVRDIVIN